MYLLGVDIGGTTIKAGVVTDEGKILLKKTVAVNFVFARVMDRKITHKWIFLILRKITILF